MKSVKSFKLSKISFRFNLWVLPVLLVFLVVLGIILYNEEKDNSITNYEEGAVLVLKQLGDTLESWINNQVYLAQSLAMDERVIAACLDPKDSIKRGVAQRLLQHFYDKHLYDGQKQIYENIALPVRLDNKKSLNISVNGENKIINDGTILVDTVNGATVGKGGANLSFIKAVFEGKDYFVSEVYRSLRRGNPIFTITVPVKKDGILIGAIILAITIDYFNKTFVEEIKFGQSGYVFFYDDRGKIISHPVKEYIIAEKAAQEFADVFSHSMAGEDNFEAFYKGIHKRYLVRKVNIPRDNTQLQWYFTTARNMDDIMKKANKFLKIMLLAGITAFVLLSGVLTFLMNKVIARPILNMTNSLKDISEGEGDLTQRLESKTNDEIGELAYWYNCFMDGQENLIRQIKDMSFKVSSVSEELFITAEQMSKTTNDIAADTESEAASLIENSNIITEMASSIKNTSDNIGKIYQAAQAVENSTDKGHDSIVKANQSMEKIDNSSGQIEGIINVIAEIANQTNLLSLNAAIEAAKAGEFGKGFAVVAEEVRHLAERSNSSLGKIKELIEISSKNVQEGNEIIDGTGVILESVLTKVKDITLQINEVTSSISEQSIGVQEIAQTSEEMSSFSENIAAAVHEMSESNRQIVSFTQDLKQMVTDLNLKINRFKTTE